MQNSAKYLICLAAFLIPGMAVADATSDKLTQIEAETMLLKARERQLEVQASIIAKQNEIAARQNANTTITSSTQTAVVGDPVVHAIEGLGGNLFATLQMADGNVVDVQVGDLLSNGMRVLSIAQGNVIVQTPTKKRVRLARYAPRPATFNPNYPTPGVVLPLPAASPRGAAR